MSITYTELKKCKNLNSPVHLQAILLYPKLVIFEDSQSVFIIDLEQECEEEIANRDRNYIFNCEIVDNALQDHLLWLVLRPGTIVVIDILNGSQIKIESDNYANYKIYQLRVYNDNLYLVSESNECLTLPYTSKELVQKMKEGITELTVSLKKASLRFNEMKCRIQTLINGLEVYVDEETLCMKCPITGLINILSADVKVKHIASWDDMAILTDRSRMWIVDVKNSEIVLEFNDTGASYYPLAVHNSNFYYLLWDKTELRVFCAWNASTVLCEDNHDSTNLNKSQQRPSSQENLKNQLKILIDAILSTPEPVQVSPQMQLLVQKIDDFDFLINTCLKLCQHNIVYKSVVYSLQKRVYATGDSLYIQALNDIIIKVDLLEYIHFRGNGNYNNIHFFELNFKELCTTFICKSDLDIACICWLKYSELKVPIESDDILSIMNSIPHNVKLAALIIWLKNFVPPLLDKNPFYIDLFVRWTTERVFLLEHSSYWPKIGLKFIEGTMSVLETSLKTIVVRPISMDDLAMLKDRISYISELKERYKINMLLSELSSQNSSEVALIMLRRCYTEDLQAFLQVYLSSYAARHSFDLDDALRFYVESEAASCGGDIDGSRLQIILNAFHSHTAKLDCLLHVLKVLDVPWSTAVLDIPVAAVASAAKDFTTTDADHALAQEIQKELNYSKVKVILKKHNLPLSCTDYNLVFHKMINAPFVDIDDLKVMTRVMTTDRHYISALYIDRCLKDCETRVAIDYFKNLSYREKSVLLKAIMNKYELIINGKSTDTTIERNYLDFLKGTRLLNEIEIKSVENLYHLKNSHDIKLDNNSMNNEECCDTEAVIASFDVGECVNQLTHSHQCHQSALLTLLSRTSANHHVRKLIKSLIIHCEDPSSYEMIPSALSLFKDGLNSQLLIDCCNILVELVLKCPEEYLHNLMKTLSILNTLRNVNILVKNLSVAWKFHYVFLPMSSVVSINDLITFYAHMSHINNFETECVNVYSRSDFIPFRMIAHVIGNTAVNNYRVLDGHILEVRYKIAKRLISKIVTCQDLDDIIITGLLLTLDANETTDDKMWILESLQGQNETLPPAIACYLSSAQVRRIFVLDNNLLGKSPTYTPQYILKSKFNMNLADIAIPDITEETWDVKVVLFYVLRQYPDTSFERLVDMCRTLNISINDGLSLQLISLLTTWELKYKVYNDDLGCRQIYFESDENKLFSKCLMIWDSISNVDFLRDILSDFWKNGEITLHGRLVSINPYFYEVYLCIYRLIFGSSLELRNTKEYFLLNFLKGYARKSAPKQYEYELFSVKGMFPEIGHYRLPFHLFMRDDMWSNLKSEITLETYKRWLPVVALLSLDSDTQIARDMICSNALKQTMISRKQRDVDVESKESEPWRLTSREEPLLRAAHKCVRNITNMEWAGACLFYVLQGCARGADQVAAAHLCYQFAQRWAAYQPGNRAVQQMERLHCTLSTRHALHKIEWACEEFVRLTTEPVQLIQALYFHPKFVEKINRHDVNQVANEIADKNGINISSIRIQILENILEKANEKTKNQCGLDTKDLITVKYILRATCPKMGAIYLSRIAFDDESDFNKRKKLRALQCLMSIVDNDTAMKVTNRERDALWTSLLELLDFVNLEHIDVPWILATLTQDKIRALEQLVSAVENNVEGLKIAADLARRHNNSQVIHNLIPLLLKADLYEEIIPLLLNVSPPPDDVVCVAWRSIMLTPFQRADYPITDRQRSRCIDTLNLLPICPIIKDEYLIEIFRNCLRCKCFGIGCLVLPYMTSQARQSLKELQRIDRRNLIASLKNLHADTYLVSGAMHVIENMLVKSYR